MHARRRALEDDYFDEYTIEKGSDIFISVWNLHRSPTLWEDSDGFNPDRWGAGGVPGGGLGMEEFQGGGSGW